MRGACVRNCVIQYVQTCTLARARVQVFFTVVRRHHHVHIILCMMAKTASHVHMHGQRARYCTNNMQTARIKHDQQQQQHMRPETLGAGAAEA